MDLRSHENNLAHRTRDIDRERLIVRRGQPFSITLQCSDSLPPENHLELVLHLGEYSHTCMWRMGSIIDEKKPDSVLMQLCKGSLLFTLIGVQTEIYMF